MTGCVSRDKFYTDRYAASLHEQKDLAEKAVHGERFLSIVSSTLKRSDVFANDPRVKFDSSAIAW